jgi:3-oxoacyl-[acyl-carrier-protein] synthase II
MAGLSPIGSSWTDVSKQLRELRSGVEALPELDDYSGMRTRLGALVHELDVSHYPRKATRSMGRVSLLAARATELALEAARLTDAPALKDGSTGISYGSTSGSPPSISIYADKVHRQHTLKGIRATDYLRFMSHTVPANLAQLFEVRGRVIPTSSACASGSQGIGYAYETIKQGKQQLMIAGGAEEFHPIDVAVFDVMYATSTCNDAPTTTPRPFDVARDGLVVGEGACTLILEDLDHALHRSAPIVAEVVGYATNCDGAHLTSPDQEGMATVMSMALDDAGLAATEIDYVNAHGTATDAGDVAESHATNRVLGRRIPVSSLKSYMGHTLGACGALEAWMTIEMMREGLFAPTLNLTDVDPRCAELDYIQHEMRAMDTSVVMSNNFAFGGINTSLIFRRYEAP